MPLDIRPRTCPNEVDVGGRGVLSATILGTDGFDVIEVDVASVRLLGVAPIRTALEDVATPVQPAIGGENGPRCTDEGPDGLLDLSLKFDLQEVVRAVEAILGSGLDDLEEQQ